MSRKVMSKVVLFIALGALLGGCAATLAKSEPSASPVTDYGLRSANVDYLTASAAHPMGLPQAAKPGDCYARAVVPAQYDAVTEQVLKKQAGTRIEIVPAEFQDVEERILVRPAGTRLEAIPPVYEEVEEQILVRQATTRVEPVPATYRTVTESILVRPAYTIWKRSSELTAAERSQQAVDPGAGDILCLVQMPDEFKTVTSEVLVTPATTREVTVPAEYTTVKKTVVKAPATTREIEVPAKYKTVTIRKVVAPERQITTATPASTTRSPGRSSARPPPPSGAKCSAITTRPRPRCPPFSGRCARPGSIPGRQTGRVDDPKTMSSVRSFQVARGLPVDNDRYINMATVRALGVTPNQAAGGGRQGEPVSLRRPIRGDRSSKRHMPGALALAAWPCSRDWLCQPRAVDRVAEPQHPLRLRSARRLLHPQPRRGSAGRRDHRSREGAGRELVGPASSRRRAAETDTSVAAMPQPPSA